MKTFSIIVAIAENNAIGKDNNLLWHISDDLKYFKQTTSEHTVIMGKNTWLSLPVKPLPKRKNIIISRTLDIRMKDVFVVGTIQDAIDICEENTENFIIGGATIYKQFLPIADKLYITKVHQPFDADVFFPEIDANKFTLETQSPIFTDEKSKLQYSFLIYKKTNCNYEKTM
ncbi:MAG: dihydrofolate reductase [Prevotellaceae bacterium]|jgi:dihydrofolate reductase|nr:dihydrofolate reductase [Prevotellaceae bacterium]